MYSLTNRVSQLIAQQSFDTPIHMIDDILDEVHAYGIKITNDPNLRKTFALNSLVSIDNGAWLLYAKQNKMTSFDDFIPRQYKEGLSYRRHTKIASVPSISYSTSDSDIQSLGDEGYPFLKIKIGSPGTQQEMLKKDVQRMKLIHKNLGSNKTNPNNSKIRYYLDANGRYETKDTFNRFLDQCRKIGVFEQILIVEEPFPESFEGDVSGINVRIAADESAHTDTDALARMEMGYSIMTLKPVAKTLSMTMRIAKLAHDRNIPCLCADLTVNPIMVDWNKCVAARLAPLPGLQVGLLETNGRQNYRNWNTMIGFHPRGNASWNKTVKGIFSLDSNFYKESAGIFLPSDHYGKLFEN